MCNEKFPSTHWKVLEIKNGFVTYEEKKLYSSSFKKKNTRHMLKISEQVLQIFRYLKNYYHMLETSGHTQEALSNMEIYYVT